jgi:hypothetical protein
VLDILILLLAKITAETITKSFTRKILGLTRAQRTRPKRTRQNGKRNSNNGRMNVRSSHIGGDAPNALIEFMFETKDGIAEGANATVKIIDVKPETSCSRDFKNLMTRRNRRFRQLPLYCGHRPFLPAVKCVKITATL